MTVANIQIPLDELNAMNAEDLLAWAWEHFGARAGIVTSFQDTGCATLHMASRVAPDLRVLTVDTLRLHPETYALIEAIELKYNIHVERFTPQEARLEQMIAQHGEFLFFDSKAKQMFCCNTRKVEPHSRALATLDVWISGLRRDQSESRGDVAKAEIVTEDHRKILKLNPLADWDSTRTRDYIQINKVPYNALYDQGYKSIGCVICSTPVQPGEEARAGRWRWFNYLDGDKKECGIHLGGSGI